jgi:copper chaperone CopZ
METILKITGMSCGACVKHVTQALQSVPGVKLAAVELNSGKAIVKHDEGADSQAMIEAVVEAGYGAQVIEDAA